MKIYTVLLRGDAEPVLVPEGFAWGALFFGPFWLAAHRAWVPAALALAAGVLVQVVTAAPLNAVLMLGLAVFLGLTGHDLRRWSLEGRGYLLANVLAARSRDAAWLRLLGERPDLAGRFLPVEAIR
jgi:hypothetical protein